MSMISSQRSALINSNVRPAVKDALRREAEENSTSMSALISEWLEERLSQLGYNFDDMCDAPESLPLPLDVYDRN